MKVSVKSKDKGMLHADFPVENREPAQSLSDLKVHLIHHAKRPFIDQVSDFHFLLFLSKGILDLNVCASFFSFVSFLSSLTVVLDGLPNTVWRYYFQTTTRPWRV